MKCAFIVRHQGVWSTRAMCRAVNVSASGFYEWFGRAASTRSRVNARLTRSIRESFELCDSTCGRPRVWHDLKAAGEHCGVNRVARLMKQANLQARRKRRRLLGDTTSRLENQIEPNHLQREFQALGPTQKWVADFTYIWAAEGWLYAADGLMASRQTGCTNAPLPPGQPVHQRRVPAVIEEPEHHLQHEPSW